MEQLSLDTGKEELPLDADEEELSLGADKEEPGMLVGYRSRCCVCCHNEEVTKTRSLVQKVIYLLGIYSTSACDFSERLGYKLIQNKALLCDA